MELRIKRKDEYEWYDCFRFVKWASRKDTKEALIDKSYRSKRKLLVKVGNLKAISEEIVVIFTYITKIICIAYYEEEKEIDLLVGYSFMDSYTVSFKVEDFSIVKILEDL